MCAPLRDSFMILSWVAFVKVSLDPMIYMEGFEHDKVRFRTKNSSRITNFGYMTLAGTSNPLFSREEREAVLFSRSVLFVPQFSNGRLWKVDRYTRSVFGLTPRCVFMKVLEQHRHTTLYIQFTNRT